LRVGSRSAGGITGDMDIASGSALVDLFDLEAAVGLFLLAAVVFVVARATLRELRGRNATQGRRSGGQAERW
jgi:hypothetical protein